MLVSSGPLHSKTLRQTGILCESQRRVRFGQRSSAYLSEALWTSETNCLEKDIMERSDAVFWNTHSGNLWNIRIFLDQATSCKRKSRVVRSSCNGKCFRGTFSSSPFPYSLPRWGVYPKRWPLSYIVIHCELERICEPKRLQCLQMFTQCLQHCLRLSQVMLVYHSPSQWLQASNCTSCTRCWCCLRRCGEARRSQSVIVPWFSNREDHCLTRSLKSRVWKIFVAIVAIEDAGL